MPGLVRASPRPDSSSTSWRGPGHAAALLSSAAAAHEGCLPKTRLVVGAAVDRVGLHAASPGSMATGGVDPRPPSPAATDATCGAARPLIMISYPLATVVERAGGARRCACSMCIEASLTSSARAASTLTAGGRRAGRAWCRSWRNSSATLETCRGRRTAPDERRPQAGDARRG
jgi:hypothetical protein